MRNRDYYVTPIQGNGRSALEYGRTTIYRDPRTVPVVRVGRRPDGGSNDYRGGGVMMFLLSALSASTSAAAAVVSTGGWQALHVGLAVYFGLFAIEQAIDRKR